MQTLVQQIEPALKGDKACFIRPAELERVWPYVQAEEREDIVREFARQHGWRIFTYNRVLGAMFVADSVRDVNQAQ